MEPKSQCVKKANGGAHHDWKVKAQPCCGGSNMAKLLLSNLTLPFTFLQPTIFDQKSIPNPISLNPKIIPKLTCQKYQACICFSGHPPLDHASPTLSRYKKTKTLISPCLYLTLPLGEL